MSHDTGEQDYGAGTIHGTAATSIYYWLDSYLSFLNRKVESNCRVFHAREMSLSIIPGSARIQLKQKRFIQFRSLTNITTGV